VMMARLWMWVETREVDELVVVVERVVTVAVVAVDWSPLYHQSAS